MTDPEFAREMAQLLGPAGWSTDPAQLESHNRDWRGRYHGDGRWLAAPQTVEQVVAIVQACRRRGIPLVPQGGNTSLCGAGVPRSGEHALILALGRMVQLRALDRANATMIAEAGMTLGAVQAQAHAGGLLFPLSLASQDSAQLGGVISTNAGGTAVLRYGNMRALVLGLEVVLPDGRIWNGLRTLRKDNSGYDLKQCFIGAEGTLGIITAAAVRLFPRPLSQATAWVGVGSVEGAVALLIRLQETLGASISGFELISSSALELVLRHIPRTRAPLTARSPWSVLIQADDQNSSSPVEDALAQALSAELERGNIDDSVLAQSSSQAAALWRLRENISEAQKLEGISVKHDISMPISRIPEFVQCCAAQLEQSFPGLRIVCFGHVGDGNLHYNLSKPSAQDNASFLEQSAQATRIVLDWVDALGGSFSAEHGIGQLKQAELVRYKSTVELDLMRTLKQAFDPDGLMNPGKVVPQP